MSNPSDPSSHGSCSVNPNNSDPASTFVEGENPFVAEFEVCDLSPLKGKTFLVAVSTGPRDKAGFLPSTIRGPFDFDGMVEDVGRMYESEQHHAKAFIASTNRKAPMEFVDENTTSYIEAHWENILVDSALQEAISGADNFTFTAGTITATEEKEDEAH